MYHLFRQVSNYLIRKWYVSIDQSIDLCNQSLFFHLSETMLALIDDSLRKLRLIFSFFFKSTQNCTLNKLIFLSCFAYIKHLLQVQINNCFINRCHDCWKIDGWKKKRGGLKIRLNCDMSSSATRYREILYRLSGRRANMIFASEKTREYSAFSLTKEALFLYSLLKRREDTVLFHSQKEFFLR